MRESIKSAAKAVVPRLPRRLAYFCIDRIEARHNPAGQWQATRQQRRERFQALRELGIPLSVMSGPFGGMRYVQFSCGSALAPKLLGTYEMEVHAAVESLCERGADLVVNLGAAEGYYAVGLAMRLPKARVIAYDWHIPAHYWLRRIAFVNRVLPRVETRGRCGASDLAGALADAQLPTVICDVEGAEDELLDPAAAPGLLNAAILAELHDMDRPGVSERVRGRFEDSHEIQQMDARPRTSSDVPPPLLDTDGRLMELMDEHRQGPQSWFLMTPKTR